MAAVKLAKKTDLDALETRTEAVERSRAVNAIAEGVAADGSDVTADLYALLTDPLVQKRGLDLGGVTAAGEYPVWGITDSLPLTTPIDAQRGGKIKALAGFPADQAMLDQSRTGEGTISTERLSIWGELELDANLQPGVSCIGADDAGGDGNPIYTVQSLVCRNTQPGVWAIGGASDVSTSLPGLLTGAVFDRVRFIECPQWINAGNNQADVLFRSVRGSMVDTVGRRATAAVISVGGYNIKFLVGYMQVKNTDADASGIKALIDAGSYGFDLDRWFFEMAESDITHFVRAAGLQTSFSMRNCKVRVDGPAPALRALAWAKLEADANLTQKRLRFEDIELDGGQGPLTDDVAAGDTEIPLDHPERVENGSKVVVDVGEPTEESVTITDASTSPPTCTAFIYPHAIDTAVYAAVGLIDVKHEQGAAASGRRLSVEVSNCDRFLLGAFNGAAENDGFDLASSFSKFPAVALHGQHRARALNALVTPALGTRGKMIPADTLGAGEPSWLTDEWKRTDSSFENMPRSDPNGQVVPATGNIYLFPLGLLLPRHGRIQKMRLESYTTVGATITTCQYAIVEASTRKVMALTDSNVPGGAGSWAATTPNDRTLDWIVRDLTADVTNASKVVGALDFAVDTLWRRGDPIAGTGIPVGAVVTDIDVDANELRMSVAATATNTGVALSSPFRAWGALPVLGAVLIVGGTMPGLAGRSVLRSLTARQPYLAGISNTGVSAIPAVGTVLTAPSSAGAAVPCPYAALLPS